MFAQPGNQAAKDLLADAFEQLGYQKESPTLRNIFLQGAYELRNGLPGGTPVRSSGPDMIRAMSTENWLDFIGIGIDPSKAEGMRFVINLVTPDNGEKYLIEMSNATLTNIKGEQAKKPDLTITVNRADLNLVMMGTSSFDDLIKAGKAKFAGDRKPFDQLSEHPGHVRAELRDPAGNRSPDYSGGADAKPTEEANPFKVPDLTAGERGRRLTAQQDRLPHLARCGNQSAR